MTPPHDVTRALAEFEHELAVGDGCTVQLSARTIETIRALLSVYDRHNEDNL